MKCFLMIGTLQEEDFEVLRGHIESGRQSPGNLAFALIAGLFLASITIWPPIPLFTHIRMKYLQCILDNVCFKTTSRFLAMTSEALVLFLLFNTLLVGLQLMI
ncbi:hypothetical protein [Psychrobacillus sp. FJAT-51614]|uniref:hypothetical protein n=1 Tax=Psychrobacillus mangrovi TaxID=3117745 RepID=UPI0030132F2D